MAEIYKNGMQVVNPFNDPALTNPIDAAPFTNTNGSMESDGRYASGITSGSGWIRKIPKPISNSAGYYKTTRVSATTESRRQPKIDGMISIARVLEMLAEIKARRQ